LRGAMRMAIGFTHEAEGGRHLLLPPRSLRHQLHAQSRQLPIGDVVEEGHGGGSPLAVSTPEFAENRSELQVACMCHEPAELKL
jgi:hypothetical protein